MPDARDTAGFEEFMERYTRGLAVERAAVEVMKPFPVSGTRLNPIDRIK